MAQGFLRGECGAERQQAQTRIGAGAAAAFSVLRILQFLAQELHASADAEHVAPVLYITEQGFVQAAAANGTQISQGLLAAGNHNRIGLTELFTGGEPTQLHRRFGFQRIQIREVAE